MNCPYRHGRRNTLGSGGRAEAEEDIVLRFLGAVGDRGHVGEVDRLAVGNRHHQALDRLGVLNELPGLNKKLPVLAREGARLEGGVSLLERPHDLQRRELITGQPGRVELDPQLAGQPPLELGLGHVVAFLQLVAHLAGYSAQGEMVVPVGPEGQRQDRHVVDRFWHHQRFQGTGGEDGAVAHHLVVELDQRLLHVFAHQVANGDDPHAGTGGGIDVLHPLDLPHPGLDRLDHTLFDLPGGRAGHGKVDIYHRDYDLRLLFAGGHLHRKNAEEEGRRHDQGGQLGIYEGAGDPSRDAEVIHLISKINIRHGVTETEKTNPTKTYFTGWTG